VRNGCSFEYYWWNTQPVTIYTNCLFTGEKDLLIKPNKEWSHMEKLEYDKLEWMEDLPPPSTDNKEVL